MAFISNGTTMLDAGAFSVSLGDLVKIKSISASNDSTISFVNGSSSVVFDATYHVYLFVYKQIHPSASNPEFGFNFSDDTSSHAYNLQKTGTYFNNYNNEGDNDSGLGYNANQDMTNSTGIQTILEDLGNDNDQAGSGYLFVFNPANTATNTHYMGRSSNCHGSDYSQDIWYSGYVDNGTAATTAVQFKMSSGDIDTGLIDLYGFRK